MDNYIYEKLNAYFNALETTGYLPYSTVESLIEIICLNELIDQIYE